MVKPADIPVADLQKAARRPEVVAAMHDFYAELDRRVGQNSPVCWNRGSCCKFGQFGHRLYVTALEAVYYLAAGGDFEVPFPSEDKCPHAQEGRCCARDRRPLGCRVFYCDPAAQHWQGPLTEEMLAELRRLHQRLQVPYFYADWLTVLQALAGQQQGGCSA